MLKNKKIRVSFVLAMGWAENILSRTPSSPSQMTIYTKFAFGSKFFALNNGLMDENFSFSTLSNKKVNTLIFPNLSSGNIAYKLLQEITEGDAIGPVLVGLSKSIHVLQMGSTVREIINMVKVAVVDAQNK